MEAKKVLVRTYPDLGRILYVWGVTDKVVLLTDREHLLALKEGSTSYPPLGFPLRDVYKVDHDIENTVVTCGGIDLPWETYTQWNP